MDPDFIRVSEDDTVHIIKPMPSIREFSDMVKSYSGPRRQHAQKGKLQWKNEMEQVEFYYAVLGEDAVVWDQEVKIRQNQRITLQASESSRGSYMFNYFFNSNQPLYISGGSIFENKSMVFTNDKGSYTFTMPRDYEGHILQIIISDSFLRNYIPEIYLSHPIVDPIVNRGDPAPLVLSKLPAYVHAELAKIVKKLGRDGAGIENKLHLLQMLAHFMSVFFKDYIGEQGDRSLDRFENNFKRKAKAIIRQNIKETFWGIAYYANHLNTSPSSFKRLFNQHFGCTPLHYFKTQQCRYAQQLLKSGKHTITEIAAQLGYSTVANFVRSYKKHTGHTPSMDQLTHKPSDHDG